METTTETRYRLRWYYAGGGHRTRYFDREHFALKARDRYQAKGYRTELHCQRVLPLSDWAPASQTD